MDMRSIQTVKDSSVHITRAHAHMGFVCRYNVTTTPHPCGNITCNDYLKTRVAETLTSLRAQELVNNAYIYAPVA